MIFLLNDLTTGETIYLSEGREYKVGRRNCDISLENDMSISRNHATIKVEDNHVSLTDQGSKYFTYHRENVMNPRVETPLIHMDLIRFGRARSFRFEAYKFLVAASALSSEKKSTLKQNLPRCEGKYVDKWSEHCTHLAVEKLSLTIKVLQALVDDKPIVTVDYFADYASRVESNLSLPDINNYNSPPVAEQLLRSDFEYKGDPRRKTLFVNKVFVFLKTATKVQLQDVIKTCGGTSVSWEEQPLTWYDINHSPNEYVFIKTDNDEENVSFDAIIKQLVKDKKRAIPLNEIALAVLNCSCNEHCNPNFNKVSEVFAAPTQKPPKKHILAAETQTENIIIKTERIIPPTVEDDWASNANRPVIDDINKPEPSGVDISKPGPSGDDTNKPRPSEIDITKPGPSGIDINKSGPSGVKRVSKEPPKEPEAKKFKAEKAALVTESPAEKVSRKQKGAEDESPKLAQKRKAPEEPQASSCLKLNPFSALKPPATKKTRVNEEVNPFSLARSSKLAKSVSANNEENPFASMNISTRTTSTNGQSTLIKQESGPTNKVKTEGPRKENKLIPTKNTSFGMSSTKRSFLNHSWMSKSSIRTRTETRMDPEMAKIVEAFKDCVTVEVMPLFERTITPNVSKTTNDSIDGGKNFKKFRKVQPLKPQLTVIGRHCFTRISPGDLTGIEVNDENDSEDEQNEVVYVKTEDKKSGKPVGKKFSF